MSAVGVSDEAGSSHTKPGFVLGVLVATGVLTPLGVLVATGVLVGGVPALIAIGK